MNPYLVLFLGIAIVTLATIAVYAYLHVREGRRRWARYNIPKGMGGTHSVLCPHCRQRSYSARANRERVCPNCGKSY